MMTSHRSKTAQFHSGFHRSSHYFRSAQPDCDKADNASVVEETNKPSKKKRIDVFEFEPIGFMSHGRW